MSIKKGLLIAPEIPPNTFWSFKHIMRYVGKKAAFPPLGLLSFAAQMPQELWHFELIDLNVGHYAKKFLRQRIRAADAVFVGAMNIQRQSLVELLSGPAQGVDTPWVLGGPMASTYRDAILEPQSADDRILCAGLDYLVWGEAAPWIPALNAALDERPQHREAPPKLFIPQRVLDEPSGSRKYLLDKEIFKPLANVPVPRWDLVDVDNYHSLMIQTTAGCRFRCNFCDIVQFNGGFARAKEQGAVRRELQAIYDTGFRGGVFTVDDNFVSEPEAMRHILTAMIEFQRAHDYPFSFFTQASIDLGKEELAHLIPLMQYAGFSSVFLGIENPDPDSLKSMNKIQNIKTDPAHTVRLLQRHGIVVSAGFIFGADTDTRQTADRIVEFVKEHAILSAMTGKLSPMPHTPLFAELVAQGRLEGPTKAQENNQDDPIEYRPIMGVETMEEGHRHILTELFNKSALYERTRSLLHYIEPHIFNGGQVNVRAGIRSFVEQGFLKGKGFFDQEYWGTLLQAYRKDRKLLSDTVSRLSEFEMFGRFINQKQDGKIGLDRWHVDLLERYHTQLEHALVRYATEKKLEEIDSLIGQVRQAIELGWIEQKIGQVFHRGTLEYLRARERMFNFPGLYFVKAIEQAVMGLHYQTVVEHMHARKK